MSNPEKKATDLHDDMEERLRLSEHPEVSARAETERDRGSQDASGGPDLGSESVAVGDVDALEDSDDSESDSESDDDAYLFCPAEPHTSRQATTSTSTLDFRGIKPQERPIVLLTPILIPAGWNALPPGLRIDPFEDLGRALYDRWPHVMHVPYPSFSQNIGSASHPNLVFATTEQSHHDLVENSNALMLVVVICEPDVNTPGANTVSLAKRNIEHQAIFASYMRILVENPKSRVGAAGAQLWVVRFARDGDGQRPEILGYGAADRRMDVTHFVDKWAYTRKICPDDVAEKIIPDDAVRARLAACATDQAA